MNEQVVPRSLLNRALNLFGVVVTGSLLVTRSPALWMLPLLVGLLAWTTISLLPSSARRTTEVLLFVLAAASSLAAVGTNGVAVFLVALAVLQLCGSPNHPPWQGLSVGIGSIGLIALPALVVSFPALGLLSIEFGVIVAMLAGYNRRQQRRAEAQSRALLEERVILTEEQARAEVLAERQAVSRDIHDVLAHSLGGLVIQLDAVAALLEVGRVSDAATRVDDARQLAVSGLTEARRAVGALRDDAETTTDDVDLSASVAELVCAHRSLGGTIVVDETGSPHPLDRGEASALSRVLQEALTNARKHAPGSEVRVALHWTASGVRFEIVNPLADERSVVATTGGGRGLVGMAERVAALPNATFSAGERDGLFEVSAAIRSGA